MLPGENPEPLITEEVTPIVPVGVKVVKTVALLVSVTVSVFSETGDVRFVFEKVVWGLIPPSTVEVATD